MARTLSSGAVPLLLLLVCALALAFAGCVGIAEESATQLDEVGDVEIVTVVCGSEAGIGATCSTGNDGRPAGSGEFQLLMGYRVPVGVAPPESVVAREGTIALARNAAFSAELERVAPAPAEAAQRWVGYVSPAFEFSPGQSEGRASIVARMALTRTAAGNPFAGPLRYRTIVGYREADPDPARPVQCGATLSEAADGGRCMDAPSEEDAATDQSVPTRDLGILVGSAGAVTRGGAGDVPFTVAYAGASPSPSWALSATTTVPGGTVSTAPEIAPAETGTYGVPVTLSVPPSAPPGRYEVALAATHGTGQTRRATALVTVVGADLVDRNPPEVAVRLRTRPRLRRARRIGIVADVSCSEVCTITAQLRAGRRAARSLGLRIPRGSRAVVVGSTAEKRAAAGRRNVRIRFRRGTGTRLARLRRLSLSLSVSARDAAGNTRRRSVQFSLRR